MPRIHNLPFADHVPYVTVQALERWATLGTISPLVIGVLLAYLYLVCGRHVPA